MAPLRQPKRSVRNQAMKQTLVKMAGRGNPEGQPFRKPGGPPARSKDPGFYRPGPGSNRKVSSRGPARIGPGLNRKVKLVPRPGAGAGLLKRPGMYHPIYRQPNVKNKLRNVPRSKGRIAPPPRRIKRNGIAASRY